MAKAKDPENDGRKNNGGPRPKVREDDKRGAAPGGPQEPFEPTDAQRKRVRTLIKSCTAEEVAIMEEISLSTLRRHFAHELAIGRLETKALIGSKLIEAALGGCKARQMFYLRTQGGWSSKVEHMGAGGGPIRTFDLSKFSPEELEQMMPLLDQLIEDGGGSFDPADLQDG